MFSIMFVDPTCIGRNRVCPLWLMQSSVREAEAYTPGLDALGSSPETQTSAIGRKTKSTHGSMTGRVFANSCRAFYRSAMRLSNVIIIRNRGVVSELLLSFTRAVTCTQFYGSITSDSAFLGIFVFSKSNYVDRLLYLFPVRETRNITLRHGPCISNLSNSCAEREPVCFAARERTAEVLQGLTSFVTGLFEVKYMYFLRPRGLIPRKDDKVSCVWVKKRFPTKVLKRMYLVFYAKIFLNSKAGRGRRF